MKFSEVLVLFAAGTLGGIFSTVVSIASLVTYPVLLALGVPPLSANMTRIKRLSPTADGGNRLGQGVALFAVAMYVGYFGAAAGVMLLVVLSMMISEALVKVNAVKNAVSGMANAMAAVCFALFGDVRWALVAPLAAGFLVGGWIGPKIARKVPAGPFRVVVSMCGVGLAVKLGISAYR